MNAYLIQPSVDMDCLKQSIIVLSSCLATFPCVLFNSASDIFNSKVSANDLILSVVLLNNHPIYIVWGSNIHISSLSNQLRTIPLMLEMSIWRRSVEGIVALLDLQAFFLEVECLFSYLSISKTNLFSLLPI